MRRLFFYSVPFLGWILVLQSTPMAGLRATNTQSPALSPLPLFSQLRPQSPSVRADLDFGRMPLYFIANQGHLDERVAYYAQGKDKTIYFTPEGLTIALSGKRETDHAGSK